MLLVVPIIANIVAEQLAPKIVIDAEHASRTQFGSISFKQQTAEFVNECAFVIQILTRLVTSVFVVFIDVHTLFLSLLFAPRTGMVRGHFET